MSPSGSKDMFSSRITQNKSEKETLTPHRIAVILFVKDFCDIKIGLRDGTEVNGTVCPPLQPDERRCFAILALQLIMGEDMELSELQELIKEQKELMLDVHVKKFEASLSTLYSDGIGALQDLFQSLGSFLTEPSHMAPILTKTSVIGLFFRRMMVLFDKLSFSQVVSTYESFKQYIDKNSAKVQRKDQASEVPLSDQASEVPLSDQASEVLLSDQASEVPLSDQASEVPLSDQASGPSSPAVNEVEMSFCDDSKLSLGDLSLDPPTLIDPAVDESHQEMGHWTRRQAELFISQQANLIQSNSMEAMGPQELQQKITDLLKANPDYAEAHYLSFLNCVRSKEFCGAIDSLFHCFDRNTLISDTKLTTQDEKSRASRYAVLNLAILYAQFGHKNEAVTALKSAIMLAHENSDNVCLQHSLSWLHKLCDENKEVLMERLISKSSDLNLCHLTSLGIQSFAHYAAITAGKPSLVFDLLMKSDALNCQHSLNDLMCNSYALKAALWCMYGKTDMMSISSQLLLNLNTPNVRLGINEYNGEGACQAICNVANVFMEKGDYLQAHDIVGHARGRFPHEPISHTWMICEQIILFTHALHQEKWQEAQQAVTQLSPLDQWESKLRQVELYIAKAEYTSASAFVQSMLDSGLANKNTICPTTRARAFILDAEVQCCSSAIVRTSAVGINLFLNSLKFTQLHHLDYLSALVGFHLANVQFQMGLPTQGLKLVDQFMLNILTNGGCFDQGRALLMMVKLKMSATVGSLPAIRQAVLLSTVPTLDKIKAHFAKADSLARVKDVLYIQCLVFDELGNNAERNRCSWEYRKLDEYHPTKVAATLLTRL